VILTKIFNVNDRKEEKGRTEDKTDKEEWEWNGWGKKSRR
jgi:hypothetical protein